MPAKDGTGPQGQGPKSGRGAGKCGAPQKSSRPAGQGRPGGGNRRGRGRNNRN